MILHGKKEEINKINVEEAVDILAKLKNPLNQFI